MSIRLYSTLSRKPRSSRSRRGRFACTSAADRVPARARRQLAAVRARDVAARWLRSRGYEVTLVHNITDVDDKVYERRRTSGRQRRARRRGDGLVPRGHRRLGLGRPDIEPGSETFPEIVAFIEALVADGLRVRVGGDVYFRVSAYPEYGELSGARVEDMVNQEPNPEKEDERDFALWKAQKPHRGRGVGLALGPGPAGLAHRVLGDGREAPRARVRDPRRRARPALPAPRERARTVAARGYAFAQVWPHNGMLELGDEKMSKSLGNVSRCATCSTRGGARRCCCTT